MPHHASTQIEPYAGEFEKAATRAPRVPRGFSESRQRSASQRGGWGSEPPDPGSAHTSNIRNSQIYTVCRLAHYHQSGMMLIPNLRSSPIQTHHLHNRQPRLHPQIKGRNMPPTQMCRRRTPDHRRIVRTILQRRKQHLNPSLTRRRC